MPLLFPYLFWSVLWLESLRMVGETTFKGNE